MGGGRGVELQTRTRIFSTPATAPDEVLTVDRCAIFYEENMERLCPLDVSRSEIWGAAVVFCRYVCGPQAPPEKTTNGRDSRRPRRAGDPLEHGKRRTHLPRGGSDAPPRETARILARRERSAPRRARLLGASPLRLWESFDELDEALPSSESRSSLRPTRSGRSGTSPIPNASRFSSDRRLRDCPLESASAAVTGRCASP